MQGALEQAIGDMMQLFSFTLSDGAEKTKNLLYNIGNEGYKDFEIGQVEELIYNQEYDELIKPQDPWFVLYLMGYGFGIILSLLGLVLLVIALIFGQSEFFKLLARQT